MGHSILSPGRRSRVLSVALAATASLYVLVVFVAEPLRTLAATFDTVVQFTVTSSATLTCSSSSTLGSAAGTGTSGTGALATAYCNPATNDSLGYTLSWNILAGSGAPAINANCTNVNTCYGTGHLLSNNVTGGYPDIIASMRSKTTTAGWWDTNARLFQNSTVPTASGSRWGARLMANSTTPAGATITWGADTAQTMGFVAVNTGAAVNIAKRTTETSSSGDIENFLFKVVIPSSVFQPTGTYKATIRFTVTDN